MEHNSYIRKKAKGVCIECGAKLIGKRKGKTLCTKCSNNHVRYMAENVAFFREHNLCPRCGKEKLQGNEKQCPECRVKGWMYNIEYNKNHPEKRLKEYEKNKMIRLYRSENNLCTICGTELTDEHYKMCEKCRLKKRIAAQKRRVAYV